MTASDPRRPERQPPDPCRLPIRAIHRHPLGFPLGPFRSVPCRPFRAMPSVCRPFRAIRRPFAVRSVPSTGIPGFPPNLNQTKNLPTAKLADSPRSRAFRHPQKAQLPRPFTTIFACPLKHLDRLVPKRLLSSRCDLKKPKLNPATGIWRGKMGLNPSRINNSRVRFVISVPKSQSRQCLADCR